MTQWVSEVTSTKPGEKEYVLPAVRFRFRKSEVIPQPGRMRPKVGFDLCTCQLALEGKVYGPGSGPALLPSEAR